MYLNKEFEVKNIFFLFVNLLSYPTPKYFSDIGIKFKHFQKQIPDLQIMQ